MATNTHSMSYLPVGPSNLKNKTALDRNILFRGTGTHRVLVFDTVEDFDKFAHVNSRELFKQCVEVETDVEAETVAEVDWLNTSRRNFIKF